MPGLFPLYFVYPWPVLLSQQVDVHHHRTDSASLGAGSQAPRFNATVVAWPLSYCGIATSVSFAMHLFNPLGVRSYRESESRAVSALVIYYTWYG